MAHVLTDEAFALAIGHFRRIGRADEGGYWIGAIASTFIPWNLATLVGVYAGGSIADPSLLGIDIIFPAAMIGLAAGLITGRRELVAAFAGAAIAVSWALLVSPRWGQPSTGSSSAASSVRWSGCSSRPRWRPSAPRSEQRRPRSASRCREPASTMTPRACHEHRPHPARNPHVRGHVPVARPRPARARRSTDSRRPRSAYLQLVGPAVLAALAAVGGHGATPMAARRSSTSASSGSRCWPASAIVVWRKNLLLGLVVAVAIVVVARATEFAALPPSSTIQRWASASISTRSDGSMSADTSTSVAAGPDVAEALGLDRHQLARSGHVGDEHPDAHDVGKGETRLARARSR